MRRRAQVRPKNVGWNGHRDSSRLDRALHGARLEVPLRESEKRESAARAPRIAWRAQGRGAASDDGGEILIRGRARRCGGGQTIIAMVIVIIVTLAEHWAHSDYLP